MKKYLLDTNIITFLEDKDSELGRNVYDHLVSEAIDKIYVSILTCCEYENSIAGEKDALLRKKLLAIRNHVYENFGILQLTLDTPKIFGELKQEYKKFTKAKQKNLQQHNIDFLIASIALEYGLVLVSNDSIFEVLQKIQPSLSLVDWSQPFK